MKLLCLSSIYRYVCWSASILKSHPKLKSALGDQANDYTEKLLFDQKIYGQYYVQVKQIQTKKPNLSIHY